MDMRCSLRTAPRDADAKAANKDLPSNRFCIVESPSSRSDALFPVSSVTAKRSQAGHRLCARPLGDMRAVSQPEGMCDGLVRGAVDARRVVLPVTRYTPCRCSQAKPASAAASSASIHTDSAGAGTAC